MPLWKDPVGWADQIAKTKRRVLIFSLVQVVFVGGGLGCIYWISGDVEVLQNPRLRRLVPILVGAGPILGFGIGYPIMCVYALHRLLLIIRSEK